MARAIPLLPTLVVAAGVATMIGFGVWQGFVRLPQKEAAIERFRQAQTMSADVPWPHDPADYEKSQYRHSRVVCDRVTGTSAIAGRSAQGESGWAQVAHCELDGGGAADVALGWTREPSAPLVWSGGEVAGFVSPAGDGVRLVATPAQAGLQQLAAPDPNDLPNNHLSYAVQWFFFAATALVIYVLALRRRRPR